MNCKPFVEYELMLNHMHNKISQTTDTIIVSVRAARSLDFIVLLNRR